MKIKNLKFKIIFLGTPDFIEPVIESLHENFDLVKIIRKPIEFNENEIQEIKNLSPDFFIVAAYGKILPINFLSIPKIGSINIHPSLLPKYRGPSPIQESILNGDKTTGVSIIKMDEEMDHGPILDQIEADVLPTDTFESLAKRLFANCTNALVRVISDYETIKPKLQDDSKATYTKLLSKQSGFIDLKNYELERAIRAYYPWPGVWTKFDINDNGSEKIIKLLPNQRIQVEGKKEMTYIDFINGYKKGEEFLRKLNLS
jgi:methionyl-tRNA formyltransferase